MSRTLLFYPLRQLAGHRTAWGPALLWGVLAVLSALGVHGRGVYALDRFVTGSLGELFLPLLCLSLTTGLFARDHLRKAAGPLVLFGATKERAVALQTFAAPLVCGMAGALVGALTIVLARTGPLSPWLFDLFATTWVGGLAGAAYGSLFALGSTVGRRGGGRVVLLVLDWIVGPTGALAHVLPRGHVNNLLGAAVRIDIAPRWSALCLVGLAAFWSHVAFRRATR